MTGTGPGSTRVIAGPPPMMVANVANGEVHEGVEHGRMLDPRKVLVADEADRGADRRTESHQDDACCCWGLPGLWLERRPGERRALIVAGGLAALGRVIVLPLSFALLATTQRYEVDFATLLLMPAFVIWALL